MRRVEQGQHRLDAIARLAGSLHPEAPLKRGFARVTDASGKTIQSREAAVELLKAEFRVEKESPDLDRKADSSGGD